MSAPLILRPIRTDDDLNAALDRLNAIFHAASDSPEADEREVLAAVIHDYERRHHPVENHSDRAIEPAEALRFHMERLGLRPRDLVPYLGATSRVSEVLAGRRRPTVDMIARLWRGLGIPPEDLLGGAGLDA